MSKSERKLAVKSDTNMEIRMFEGSDSSTFEKIRDYLIDYNEKSLDSKRHTALIAAYVKDEVAGGVSFRWYGPSAFLDYVVVSEKWRGQGIGRKLLTAVEEELQRQGCQQIFVDTEAFQAPDFYRRAGYELVTTVQNYICGYDQLILRKFLPETKVAR